MFVFNRLSRKRSMDSFVSPSARLSEAESAPPSGKRLPNFHSISQFQSSISRLPSISSILSIHVIRTVSVSSRQKNKKGKGVWSTIWLRLTSRALSLHNQPEEDVYDIIFRTDISHVARVDDADNKKNCLQVVTINDLVYQFAFDQESDLYDWLTDLSPLNAPTDYAHHLHVYKSDNLDTESRLIGLPADWKSENPVYDRITHKMIEDALPEIILSTDQSGLVRDFNQRISCLTNSFEYDEEDYEAEMGDMETEEDIDAVFLKAQIAKRADSHKINIASDIPSLKIVTGNLLSGSHSGPLTALDASPCTPMLTPDKTPLTPFRESPYSYRETDARNLTGQVIKQDNWACAHGGYADIWRAKWMDDSGVIIAVAVKVLRVISMVDEMNEKLLRRLNREVRVWHQLRHKNVVQMYGTCDGFGKFPSMVSAWYNHGHVNAYLTQLGDDATVLVRLKLLIEVACGLNYLHTFTFPSTSSTDGANIVHGDLKGANILVNDSGEAALADFGLSSIIAVAEQSITSTFGGGSVRWMAPELISPPEDDVPSKKTCASDTYSYGSVILEIMSGEKPYKDVTNDMHLITQISKGIKPEQPSKPVVPLVWELMKRCWNDDPKDRPQMSFVLSRMEKYYSNEWKSQF